MGKRPIIYGVILLFSAAAAVFYWDYIAVVLLWLVLLLPAILFLFPLSARPFIQVSWETTAAVTVRGKGAALVVTVDNRSPFHIANAQLSLTMTHTLSGESVTERLVFPLSSRNVTRLTIFPRSEHCGKMAVRLNRIWLYDWLGITGVCRTLSGQTEAVVLPQGFPMDLELLPAEASDELGTHYSGQKPGQDPSQVFGYHEYGEGDKLKNVHWKLSDRLNRLMVKEFSQPVSSSVALAVDCRKGVDPDSLDGMLELAFSLSQRLLQLGVLHDLLYFSAEYGLEKRSIQTEDDIYQAIQRMFEAPVHSSSPLLQELAACPQEFFYAKTIYATPQWESPNLDLCKELAAKTCFLLFAYGTPECREQLEAEGLSVYLLPYGQPPGQLSDLEL